MRQLQIVDSQDLGHFKKKKSFAKVEDWITQIFHMTQIIQRYYQQNTLYQSW